MENEIVEVISLLKQHKNEIQPILYKGTVKALKQQSDIIYQKFASDASSRVENENMRECFMYAMIQMGAMMLLSQPIRGIRDKYGALTHEGNIIVKYLLSTAYPKLFEFNFWDEEEKTEIYQAVKDVSMPLGY